MLAALLTTGCGTLQAYPGPARIDTETAQIKSGHMPGMSTQIIDVDGRSLALWQDRAELLPGDHSIQVDLIGYMGTRRYQLRLLLTFTAEAGHRYVVLGDWFTSGPGVRIEDLADETVVAEAAPELVPVGANRR